MSEFIGPPDPAIIADDEAWYRERSDRIWRAIDARNAPHVDQIVTVPFSTDACTHCFGLGTYQGETCPWCDGYGSQATLTVASDHFDRIQRIIMGIAAE